MRAAVLLLAALGCEGEQIVESPPDSLRLVLAPVATGLSQPVAFATAPGDGRLFIAERTGRIRVVEGTTLRSSPFLDLSGVVGAGGSEQGLLGLAFDPDFATTRYFWVSYTDTQGDTRVVRYRRSLNNPAVADPASGTVVLAVDQPFANHNGGQIAFGPDGLLFVGLGDGGGAGDPQGAGQDPTTLLGKLLRIDVRGAQPYVIPPDNPFAGDTTVRQEIWALGLRNPWRWSFDVPGDRLYVADVGQNLVEEVNAVPADAGGRNYGWSVAEGDQCFVTPTCDVSGFVAPVLTYTHEDGCSVTGGFVYRGAAIPELAGHYFYSDYCGGWLRSFRLEADTAAGRREWDVGPIGSVTSFGVDRAGELLILTAEGDVWRLARE